MYKYCIVHNNIGDSSSLVLCVFGFLGAESLTWYWFSGLVGAGPEAPPTPSVRSRGAEMERRPACSGELRPFSKVTLQSLFANTHKHYTHACARTHAHTLPSRWLPSHHLWITKRMGDIGSATYTMELETYTWIKREHSSACSYWAPPHAPTHLI